MMKKWLALILCLSTVFVVTACGSKDDAPQEDADDQIEESADSAETSGEDVSEDGAPAEDASEEAVFTGVLEEKKDFMIIVTAEDGSASYAFHLPEGVTCDAEVGETVTVSFTGDTEVPEADQDLTAVEITVAE